MKPYNRDLDLDKDVIRDMSQNVYYKQNPQNFMKLREECLRYPKSMHRHIRFSFPDLYDWVNESLPLLNDSFYNFSTKLFWIFSGMTGFKECKCCKKPIGQHINVNITRGYNNFCSLACSQSSEQRLSKMRMTLNDHEKEDPYFWSGVQKKREQTNILRGHDLSYNNREKSQKTCMKKYGVSHVSYIKSVKEKEQQTKILKYGTSHPNNHYVYDNIYFDSKDEIVCYIWLRDNCKTFNFHPKDEGIPYEFDGRTCHYEPDLEIDSKLIEIKGSHFFNQNGEMTLPYKYKRLSDEQFQKACEKLKAKQKCMERNNVIIMKTNCLCMKVIWRHFKTAYRGLDLNKFKVKAKQDSNDQSST